MQLMNEPCRATATPLEEKVHGGGWQFKTLQLHLAAAGQAWLLIHGSGWMREGPAMAQAAFMRSNGGVLPLWS
jgi:hypothetical protein